MARIKRGKQVFAEINITPLTDVCLVLLIIFMVTATFLTQSSGLDVALPRAASAQELPAKQIEVTVTTQGAVYIDGEMVPKEALDGALSQKLQQTSVRTVIIKADAKAPYQHVIDVMSAVRVQGADITLAAEATPGAAPTK